MSSNQAPSSEALARLGPIVDLLVAAGNEAVHGGFINSQGGWYCLMKSPLNFDLVRSEIALPDGVELSPHRDEILDRRTWYAVVGPGALVRRDTRARPE